MEEWKLRRFLKLGKGRRKVLQVLSGKPYMVSEIASKTETSIPNISRILGELKKAKLVKCLNPEVRKGKVYSITELGKNIMKKVEKYILKN